MKVWVVRGGERYDDATYVIGVCATEHLAEELQAEFEADPHQWATIDEEPVLTEIPDRMRWEARE
ncbi:hypothetical protein QNA24_29885 [Rhodococcus qingshengii]|uniref:DUF7336 domain-containing protein n=1 Tax=Rhodococcus TaxID=1827 RepID=UPI001E310835|nr:MULTISPECIES: hypothetical protein [Rhodococcus]MCD2099582.1 hypothetical protein [Rhodococcus rhodochrous]MCD2123950.1 hypothetical protein [Rhodococcus rhodochrous]MCQ4136621.1 hypothetical protein [Rhodococcus rhodochrous]MDJ0490594.1 hypothetical protein [Rhodococcus qingshengii]